MPYKRKTSKRIRHPGAPPRIERNDEMLARLFAKTEADPNGGCIFWAGSLQKGYGRFFANQKPILAHRAAYELTKGPIPLGLHLDHLCRVICCVNPDHLEPVTPQENVARGHAFRAKLKQREECDV